MTPRTHAIRRMHLRVRHAKTSHHMLSRSSDWWKHDSLVDVDSEDEEDSVGQNEDDEQTSDN